MEIISLALYALTAAQPTETVSPVDRANGVIAQRTRMPNRYTLRLRVEGRVPNAPAPVESETTATLHLWRDGNKFRVDHFDSQYTPARPKHDSRDRRITCENCEREGYGIVTTVLPGPPPTQPMVEFHRLGTRNFDSHCTHFDWRYFGLSNHGSCHYSRLKVAAAYPTFFGLAGVFTRSERRGGVPCLVASRKTDHLDRSVWLSEPDGFNPVFFDDQFVVGGVPERRTTEITWQRTAGGHLYPNRVKHNTMITLGGKQYASEELTTVTHADFESPIDPAVFTLAGFGLNEGQVIGLPEIDDLLDKPVWRNGRLDPTYTVRNRMAETAPAPPGAPQSNSGPPASAPYPVQGNTSFIVGVVAAVLSVTTAAAAFVVRRRRASA